MAGKFESIAILLARILICMIFIEAGIKKIPGWEQTSQFMASKGMPLVPLFLIGAIAVEILGGLSVLIGFKSRVGSLVLFLYLIPTTLIFHNFISDPSQSTQFLKNMAIMGGLLLLAASGPGIFSLDAKGRPKR